MSNSIKAAEQIEEQIVQLKDLLAKQEILAERVGGTVLDEVVKGTKAIIAKNEATAKLIRETATDG